MFSMWSRNVEKGGGGGSGGGAKLNYASFINYEQEGEEEKNESFNPV